jgi:hypothetical protein
MRRVSMATPSAVSRIPGRMPPIARSTPREPLLPVLMEAMERHGRLELDPVVRAGCWR